MTALKPIENRLVRGVSSTKYPINTKCAHPECGEDTAYAHHCFPRSQIGNASYFVEIIEGPEHEAQTKTIIPHAVGLCRAHHDDVELHHAWIKLEDGVFAWHQRDLDKWQIDDPGEWSLLGPLNPQPGSREGKPKRKKLLGEARRQRRTISLKVPDDTEDGGAIWDETMAEVKERLVEMGLYSPGDTIPYFEALIAALRDWLNS